MSWNYRVIARKDLDDSFYYEIHEVYYNKKGKPTSWTKDAVGVFGRSQNELKKDIKLYRRALKLPTLYWDEKKDKLYEKNI